jgi:hypothetical protein
MGWKIKGIIVQLLARTKCPWLWDQFSLPINGHQRLFPGDKAANIQNVRSDNSTLYMLLLDA